MVYDLLDIFAERKSFELAPNGALWYNEAEREQVLHVVLNLPPTGHYGIRQPSTA